MKEVRIAILASGRGSNAEGIIRYFQNHPMIRVVRILSNNAGAGVLARAANLQIPTFVFSREQWERGEVLEQLKRDEITHIVLAGFLWLIPQTMINAFPDHIINIHPSLLPRFGGKGMYGMKVHEAVKQAGEKVSGITIHLVNAHFDEGKILFQESCPISPSDTVTEIAGKVNALELAHYPKVIRAWVSHDPLRD